MKDILIIQDSPALNALLKHTLESNGLSVDLTETGSEGLKAASKYQYSLILLDYVLPKTNGEIVCSKLKQMPLTKSTPVIFISGKEETELIEIVKRSNAEGYLTPPFRGNEFINKVMNYMK